MMRSQTPHATPTRRDATAVSEMMPLFCAKVVRGSTPASADRTPDSESFTRAPFWRRICSGLPETSSRDASMDACVSAHVSQEVMRNTMSSGIINGG